MKVRCHSLFCDGVGLPVDTKKKFSFEKAIVGNTIGFVLAGAPGAIIGAATGVNGKRGKTTFVCMKCGRTWEQKV